MMALEHRGAVSMWVGLLVVPVTMVITAVVFDTMAGFNQRAKAQDMAWALSAGAASQVVVIDGGPKIDQSAALSRTAELADALDTGFDWSLTLSETAATVHVEWEYETLLLGAVGIDRWSATEVKVSIVESED